MPAYVFFRKDIKVICFNNIKLHYHIGYSTGKTIPAVEREVY